MMLRDRQALEDFAKQVRQRLGGKLVALKLFGSKARGDDAPDSDIDVLVEVEEGGPSIEDVVLDIAFEVNVRHDVYISPRVIERAVFEHPVWRTTPFIRHLEERALPL
jgi:antitoxin ChpS